MRMTVSRTLGGMGHLCSHHWTRSGSISLAFPWHLSSYLFLPFFFARERQLVASNSPSIITSRAMGRMPPQGHLPSYYMTCLCLSLFSPGDSDPPSSPNPAKQKPDPQDFSVSLLDAANVQRHCPNLHTYPLACHSPGHPSLSLAG